MGVKFNNIVFKDEWFLICYKKWSLSLYKLFAYKNYNIGHLLTNWNNWSDTLINPPIFNIFKWVNPYGCLFLPFSPYIKLLIPSSLIVSHPVRIIYYNFVHIPNLLNKRLFNYLLLLNDKLIFFNFDADFVNILLNAYDFKLGILDNPNY